MSARASGWGKEGAAKRERRGASEAARSCCPPPLSRQQLGGRVGAHEGSAVVSRRFQPHFWLLEQQLRRPTNSAARPATEVRTRPPEF